MNQQANTTQCPHKFNVNAKEFVPSNQNVSPAHFVQAGSIQQMPNYGQPQMMYPHIFGPQIPYGSPYYHQPQMMYPHVFGPQIPYGYAPFAPKYAQQTNGVPTAQAPNSSNAPQCAQPQQMNGVSKAHSPKPPQMNGVPKAQVQNVPKPPQMNGVPKTQAQNVPMAQVQKSSEAHNSPKIMKENVSKDVKSVSDLGKYRPAQPDVCQSTDSQISRPPRLNSQEDLWKMVSGQKKFNGKKNNGVSKFNNKTRNDGKNGHSSVPTETRFKANFYPISNIVRATAKQNDKTHGKDNSSSANQLPKSLQ